MLTMAMTEQQPRSHLGWSGFIVALLSLTLYLTVTDAGPTSTVSRKDIIMVMIRIIVIPLEQSRITNYSFHLIELY